MKRLVPIAIALFLTILLANVSMAQSLANVRLSDAPDGPATTQFPAGTTTVYAIFDYANMANEPVKVRVYDNYGTILFERTQSYAGSGTESVPTTTTEGYFPDGRYVTNFYIGEYVARTVIWDVGELVAQPPSAQPTPTPSAIVRTYDQVKGLVLPAVAIVLILFVAWAVRRVLAPRR